MGACNIYFLSQECVKKNSGHSARPRQSPDLLQNLFWCSSGLVLGCLVALFQMGETGLQIKSSNNQTSTTTTHMTRPENQLYIFIFFFHGLILMRIEVVSYVCRCFMTVRLGTADNPEALQGVKDQLEALSPSRFIAQSTL